MNSCVLKCDHWPAPVCLPIDANLVLTQIKMHELKQLFTVPSCVLVSGVSLYLIRRIGMVRGGALTFCSELFQRLHVVWSYPQISSK